MGSYSLFDTSFPRGPRCLLSASAPVPRSLSRGGRASPPAPCPSSPFCLEGEQWPWRLNRDRQHRASPQRGKIAPGQALGGLGLPVPRAGGKQRCGRAGGPPPLPPPGPCPAEPFGASTAQARRGARPPAMAGPRPWLGLAWLLGMAAAASALPLGAGPRDEVLAAALQRLREVFDIEELPPDVLPRRKPPQFMVDLFNKVADANGITRAPGLLEGDVVRSFEDRGGPGAPGGGGAVSRGAPWEGSSEVRLHQQRFYFDISAIERGEQMLKAEFRVFKLKRKRVARSEGQHFCKVSGEATGRLRVHVGFCR